MPGAEWFPGTRLNYVGEYLRAAAGRDDDIAVIGVSQTRDKVTWTFGDLNEQIARVRAGLVRLGVTRGDRVVAYMPNVPETVAAFLATASLGAIWAAVAPEFGPQAVIDRFGQLEPAVLLTVDGYRYGDKDVDIRDRVAAIRAALPTLQHTVALTYNGRDGRRHDRPGTTSRASAATSSPSRCRSTIRCACCSRRAPPACRRRSCTATAASSSRRTRTTC